MRSIVYIAHRGNTLGPNPQEENKPKYIQTAIDQGYDVEVDVWAIDGKVYLGHDTPNYQIELIFLKNERIWCHAKNYEALDLMMRHKDTIHFFFHESDKYTLTSKGYAWTYPGNPTPIQNAVIVMPELKLCNISQFATCYGVCSDYVSIFRHHLHSN